MRVGSSVIGISMGWRPWFRRATGRQTLVVDANGSWRRDQANRVSRAIAVSTQSGAGWRIS